MCHDGLLRQADAKCLGMEKPLFGVAFFCVWGFVIELGVGFLGGLIEWGCLACWLGFSACDYLSVQGCLLQVVDGVARVLLFVIYIG